MELPKTIKDDIWEYSRVNNITNIDEFTIKLIKQGFTVEKYGATPTSREKIVEKIIEKIVEVPVEKIVERIIEVPIQMVDTETPEKIKNLIKLYNDSQDELIKIIKVNEELKKELEIEKNKNKRDLYGEK